MPWTIITLSKFCFVSPLNLDSFVPPEFQSQSSCDFCQVPSPPPMPSPFLELGQVGVGQGGIKLAIIRYFMPHFEVTTKLAWLCNDACGNLWDASRALSSIGRTQHTDGVCEIF